MTFNKILTDEDREELRPMIDDMLRVCPDVMARKIPEANVQQAFVLHTIANLEMKLSDKSMLSVGCFEDTAYEFLKQMKFNIVGIDPFINYSLHDYVKRTDNYFDIVFATSVLEHVANDLEFLADMCSLLKPNGLGILTMDFKDDYKLGDPLPATDVRFYTRQDLEVGLSYVLSKCDCKVVDTPDWTGKDNFVYQGHQYSFATFVFRKIKNV
jgi:SAM-dependent methyltransferase